jgi:Prenyltransferase and squalene oxidase repeat
VGLAKLLVALTLATTPISFLQSNQGAGGGFAEPGGQADAGLTAWAVLGLRAANAPAPGALAYLQSHEAGLQTTSDVALVALAEESLGAHPDALLARIRAAEKPSGLVGETLGSTFWAVLALGSAPPGAVHFILAHQSKAGGFSWGVGVQADSNDTAAALEAFHVAGVTGVPVARAVKFLLGFENKDGGFELSKGRGSDAQSTAWAIQGLLAGGRKPPHAAFHYLGTMHRPDGSYRYSAQYVTTPVWVTSQVLAALARKTFPLAG